MLHFGKPVRVVQEPVRQLEGLGHYYQAKARTLDLAARTVACEDIFHGARFELGFDHDMGHTWADSLTRGRRGDWEALKDANEEEDWLFVLGGVALFPLAWLFWFIGSLCGGSLKDGKGGIVVILLWGVLSSLAATAWTCLWDWAPWYPALVSVAALVVVLFEAIKAAAELR